MMASRAGEASLEGRVAIVTGANTGLGFECALELARRGARVVMACRDLGAGDAARSRILAQRPVGVVGVRRLDLADLVSVAQFAKDIAEDLSRLDLVINNAGVMNTPQRRTRDGFELQMGTNHLGHFALTGRLLPLLLATRGARVVTVTSEAHRSADRAFLSDPMLESPGRYAPFRAYARSKLANVLFARELGRRFDRHAPSCRSLVAHPGAAQTDLGRHFENHPAVQLFEPLLRRVVPSAASGASSILWAAFDPHARNGDAYGPTGFFGLSGRPGLVRTSGLGAERRAAAQLFEASERLTGVRFAFDRARGGASLAPKNAD